MAVKIQYEKATGKHIHIGKEGVKTAAQGLPPQASMKAVKAHFKARGLDVKGLKAEGGM